MNDNPYEPPAKEASPSSVALPRPNGSTSATITHWWAMPLSVGAWCLAYFAGWDAAVGSPPLLQTILIASISSIWIYYDAKRNGIYMVGAIQFLLFFAWMIAVPFYLVHTRKMIGLAWAVVQVIAVCGLWYAGWVLH